MRATIATLELPQSQQERAIVGIAATRSFGLEIAQTNPQQGFSAVQEHHYWGYSPEVCLSSAKLAGQIPHQPSPQL